MQVFATVEGEIAEILAAEEDRLAREVTTVINRATRWLQQELRRRVRQVFGRTRDRAARRTQSLANAVRRRMYPADAGRGQYSLGAAGLVYMRVPWIEIHITGGTITAKPERWLAIPTEEAEKRGFARALERRGAFGRFEAGSRRKVARISLARQSLQIGGYDTRFIRLKGRPVALIVIDLEAARELGFKGLRRRVTRRDGTRVRRPFVVLFVLVKTATMRPRFEVATAEQAALQQILDKLEPLGRV